MGRPQDSLSIVLPVFNEAGAIEGVLRDFHKRVAGMLDDVEFIVAEDGSTDGTKEILARLEPELGLKLVSGSKRKGYTGAVKDALELPTREWVFFSDSDGQQEPNDFFAMAETAEQGFDVVAGVKTPRRDPVPRLLLSKGLGIANRLLLGARFRDVNCGFRLMRREVIETVLPEIHLLPQFINAEFLLRADAHGYRIKQIPIHHYARADGGSRGLPPSRIPGEVWRLLRGLVALRGELKDAGKTVAAERAS